MVRLDEKVTASSQAFFLDIPSEDHDPMFAMNIDNIVEASLAMLSMLIMEGFESEYIKEKRLTRSRDLFIKAHHKLVTL